MVAACVAAKVPTRVYAVSLGGFDTHAGETRFSAVPKQVLSQDHPQPAFV
ncbi:hypothetical protein [Streptacidiphilus neutrinimicus]|nr:hypothetical protein [Streptacidiphilus neutrinimicus]